MEPYKPMDCSPLAIERLDFAETDGLPPDDGKTEKWPYSKLLIRECFIVPFNDVSSENSLRVRVSVKGKKIEKKFAVLAHKDMNCYEIVRTA